MSINSSNYSVIKLQVLSELALLKKESKLTEENINVIFEEEERGFVCVNSKFRNALKLWLLMNIERRILFLQAQEAIRSSVNHVAYHK